MRKTLPIPKKPGNSPVMAPKPAIFGSDLAIEADLRIAERVAAHAHQRADDDHQQGKQEHQFLAIECLAKAGADPVARHQTGQG